MVTCYLWSNESYKFCSSGSEHLGFESGLGLSYLSLLWLYTHISTNLKPEQAAKARVPAVVGCCTWFKLTFASQLNNNMPIFPVNLTFWAFILTIKICLFHLLQNIQDERWSKKPVTENTATKGFKVSPAVDECEKGKQGTSHKM